MEYLYLFLEFLKIGAVSFGGGFAMIPLFKEAVLAHNWLDESTFYDFVGLCESTPGPIAVNMATFVGTTVAGPLGGAIATFAVVLPAFIIILILAAIISKFLNNKYVKGALSGIQPTVLGLIFSAGIVLFLNIGFNIQTMSLSIPFVGILIYLSLFALTYRLAKRKSLGTIQLILISACLGLMIGFFAA